jgi:hypothetical protein
LGELAVRIPTPRNSRNGGASLLTEYRFCKKLAPDTIHPYPQD